MDATTPKIVIAVATATDISVPLWLWMRDSYPIDIPRMMPKHAPSSNNDVVLVIS